MRKSVFYDLLSKPVSRIEVILDYCAKKDVLDIGCIDHSINKTGAEHWLHGRIKKSADKLVGLDYLEKDVEEINKQGYKVICADATKPLGIKDRFDVIVVGNLIEHLSDFPGFFDNLRKHLKEDGVVLMSTANPFYEEQYFYSAFKNEVLINPEHTCWLDPVALDQLSARFGFNTEKVYWIKEGWPLSKVICNGDDKHYDVLSGRWVVKRRSPAEKALSPVLLFLLKTLLPGKYKKMNEKYGEGLQDILYVRFVGGLFSCFWGIYKLFIVRAPINRYELYLSVLRKKMEWPVHDVRDHA